MFLPPPRFSAAVLPASPAHGAALAPLRPRGRRGRGPLAAVWTVASALALLVLPGLARAQAAAHAAPTASAAPGAVSAASARGSASAVGAGAPVQLRVVGSLTGLNLYTQHEEPFWTHRIAQASGGRISAEIVPSERAGIRPNEMLPLVSAGTVPFAVLSVSAGLGSDPVLSAIDLAGLHPDMASLRRSAASFRPVWQQALAERHGLELLAVYTYPAQVLFCRGERPGGLDGLRGLRIRTSSLSQSDWVEGLGARPVQLPLPDTRGQLEAGAVDCAITGAMSGNLLGLHEVTQQQHPMAVNWGVSLFVANRAAWNALPADVRALLRREIAALETEVWRAAERDTLDGLACNAGRADCRSGRRGAMRAVESTPADEQRRREVVASRVLPGWMRRCGADCAPTWNRTLGPLLGIQAVALPS